MIPRGGGETRGPDVRGTPVVTWLNSAVCVIAAVSAVAVAVSWLLTFSPWTQFMSSGYFVPFFTLMFPLFGWAVFVTNVLRRPAGSRQPPADLMKAVPRGARVPLTLAAVAAGVSFLTALVSLPGQPGYDPVRRRYFYDDHGTLIPATQAGYLHAVAAQNRLFLGVTLVFTSAAAAIAWGEWSRRPRDPVAPVRWRHPVRPRPRIPVPGPALAVAAAAGLAGLAACAILIIGRVDAYNTSGPYLRAGHPVRALLAQDDYVVFVGCTQDISCPQLAPAALSVSAISGSALDVFPDPSPDRLSEAGQPFRGELSFTVPRTEQVRLDLSARPGQPVFAVPSPGEEAHALTGWIALAGLSLVVLIAAATGLVVLAWRLGFGTPVPPAQLPDIS